jgi:hypothetical protein
MALFRYACSEGCGHGWSLLSSKPDPDPRCPKCGGGARRAVNPPSDSMYDTLDNGFQTKRVERLAEVERMSHERARQKP